MNEIAKFFTGMVIYWYAVMLVELAPDMPFVIYIFGAFLLVEWIVMYAWSWGTDHIEWKKIDVSKDSDIAFWSFIIGLLAAIVWFIGDARMGHVWGALLAISAVTLSSFLSASCVEEVR